MEFHLSILNAFRSYYLLTKIVRIYILRQIYLCKIFRLPVRQKLSQNLEKVMKQHGSVDVARDITVVNVLDLRKILPGGFRCIKI